MIPLFAERGDQRFADLGDMLRRERRLRRWTQRDLADFCGVRAQTVSAWERGKAPQQRFFGKIADFLRLEGKNAVAAVLDGRNNDVTPGARQDPPFGRTDEQDRVLGLVLSLLEKQSEPSPEFIGVIHDLMASVGLSGIAFPSARDSR